MFQKSGEAAPKLQETISFKNLHNSQKSDIEQPCSTMDQLYRGEKARNQVLQKQVREYKMELEAYRSDIKQIESLKKENKEY